jgi:hypothetical protein
MLNTYATVRVEFFAGKVVTRCFGFSFIMFPFPIRHFSVNIY